MTTKLWDDEEIGGRLYLQTVELIDAVNLPKETKDQIWKVLFSCMHKLTIVKYHQRQYEQWEKIKYGNAQVRLKKTQKSGLALDVHEEFEMIAELEAFLHQVKSSLDMLAKILIRTADLSEGATATFGDYGNRLIKKLRNSSVYKSGGKEKIEELIKLIEDDQKTWLKAIVDLRDQVSHWQGVSGLGFGHQMVSGLLKPTYPTINGKRIPDFLQMIQQNLIQFHQDFLALAFRIKIFPGMDLTLLEPSYGQDKYNQASGRYVKWGLGIKQSAI